jgi:hypothetical protein
VPEKNPFVSDRVQFINNLFEKKQLLIDENCKYSIRDRELGLWKQNYEKFVIDKSKKEISHLNDAADYACWNCMMLLNLDDEYQQDNSVSSIPRENRWEKNNWRMDRTLF